MFIYLTIIFMLSLDLQFSHHSSPSLVVSQKGKLRKILEIKDGFYGPWSNIINKK